MHNITTIHTGLSAIDFRLSRTLHRSRSFFFYWQWFLARYSVLNGRLWHQKAVVFTVFVRIRFCLSTLKSGGICRTTTLFTLRQEPDLDWMNEWCGWWIFFVLSRTKLWSAYLIKQICSLGLFSFLREYWRVFFIWHVVSTFTWIYCAVECKL